MYYAIEVAESQVFFFRGTDNGKVFDGIFIVHRLLAGEMFPLFIISYSSAPFGKLGRALKRIVDLLVSESASC